MTRGDALRGWVARPALLVLWALVLWGTLLVGVAAAAAIGGNFAAVRQLLPARGASLWAWLNAGSAVLAVVAWVTAGALAWSRWRRRAETS